MSRILVVDDEPAICWAFRESMTDEGHDVDIAATAEEALQLVETKSPDVVLMDVRLPGMDGLSALKEIHEQAKSTPVIIMTAFGSLDTAVNATDGGAFDYLPKPFDLDDAIDVVRRALDANTSESTTIVKQDLGGTLIGQSLAMQAVFRSIALVADRSVPVLITGESGTGKELVAHAIHQHGRRRSGPFIPICVPALSETVIESELFGHLKGAFTGADRERPGLLDLADGGTAFMDEIGDVPIGQQVKLLRVLEHREITPVGGGQPHKSDFRLVAATNRRLEQSVSDGGFREDLYYRLSVFRIDVPPLRERLEDVELLARHFLGQLGEDTDSLTEEALRELRSRPWHGNVRELRNVIEHAAIVARAGRITPDCLPRPMGETASQPDSTTDLDQRFQSWLDHQFADGRTTDDLYERFLHRFEPLVLMKALEYVDGNRGTAAKLLGMHRETLRQKLRKHGID